jgi:large subunit ribosomal protein L15e
MTFYKSLRERWKKPRKEGHYKSRLIEWRKQPSTLKIDRPTRLDRARSLGYKAKQGIIVVRQRIIRGGKTKPKFGRRRSKRFSKKLNLSKSYQAMAEERASKKYANLEVLNSYLVMKDGKYSWYEVIMVDWANPVIRKDKKLSFMVNKRGRATRGLTSAAKKSRGLRNKGKGAEKFRPSKRAVAKKRISKKK